ncbi:MAG: mRNA-decapping enzyme subunit 2 [Tremellales sp. Tagirdzhanova-0007]|nr:MAG: mRNA-decapping enzyme subunit 2 [Tremellales sp. Tagirdzhanova-0007]
MAPRNEVEDVWTYPRPPALQRTPKYVFFPSPHTRVLRLRVIWIATDGAETVLADTTEGYRVLETTHPPTYYLPPGALKVSLQKTSKSSFCEWKGQASYHTLQPPLSTIPIQNRIWSYPAPTGSFSPIKDHLSFYASTGIDKKKLGGEWVCFVDDERVGLQEGDFYGGWVTSNLKGRMKGGPGTWGW